MSDDIWSNDAPAEDEIIQGEQPDAESSEIEEGTVLDLSGDDDLGSDYPVIPLKTHVRVRVYEGVQKKSQAGNEMYALILRTTDDEWGKNRQLRFWITLTAKALRFTLPSFAALGVPAQFNGEKVETVKQLKAAKEAAGGKGRLVFPALDNLLDAEAFAFIGEHQQDEDDEDKVWERVTKLVHVDDPKANVTKDTPQEGNSEFANPYSG